MVECPDQLCRDKVTRTATIVKVGGSVLTLMIILILAWNGNRLLAESHQNERITEVNKQVPAMQESIKHITENIRDIKAELKDMRHNQRHNIEVLHTRITESEGKILKAIRNNR